MATYGYHLKVNAMGKTACGQRSALLGTDFETFHSVENKCQKCAASAMYAKGLQRRIAAANAGPQKP